MLGIFLDTETNGLDPFTHKVLDLAIKIVDIKTGILLESYNTVLLQSSQDWDKSDPNSLKINGFTWEDVAKGKDPSTVRKEVEELFARQAIARGKAVFICQNPSFDRPFFAQIVPPSRQEELLWPYHWLDLASMHWAVSLLKKETLPWKTGLSKDSIAKAHKIAPEAKPHKAINGVSHLLACYEAVVGFSSS